MRAYLIAVFAVCWPALAQAVDVSVLGVAAGKAMLVVNGGTPRMYAVGAKLAGEARLVAVSNEGIVIEEGGKRESHAIGSDGGRTGGGYDPRSNSLTLQADEGGHFNAEGKINGVNARMMVDTGATMFTIPMAEAVRFGIDYRRAKVSLIHTANGVVGAYRVRLERLNIGDMELYQVDAMIQDGGLPIILLGNNVLSRFDMRRVGAEMTLTKR